MNTNQNITIGDSTYNTTNLIAKQLNLIEKHIIDAFKEIGVEIDLEKNIIDEIKEKFDNLDKEQQQAVAIIFTKTVLQ